MSHTITLNWTPVPNTTFNVSTYGVYKSIISSSGPFSRIANTGNAVFTYTDSAVVVGGNYWYGIKATDISGNTSILSDVIAASIPLPIEKYTTVSFNAKTGACNDVALLGTSFGNVAFSNSSVSYATWANVAIMTGNVNAVTSFNNLAVAVGDNGQIYYGTYEGGFTTGWFDNWTKDTSSPTSANLLSVYNGFGGTIFAVGVGGVIVANTGSGYVNKTSGVAVNLRGVTTFGSVAIAVGDGGTILTSTSPFNTWTKRTSGTSVNLRAVCADNDHAVIVGDGGTILVSVDVVNWSAASSGTTQDLYGVTADGNASAPFGAVGNNGTTLISTDGSGVTWSAKNSHTTSNLLSSSGGLSTMNWLSSGDNGVLIKSTDIGSTWTVILGH